MNAVRSEAGPAIFSDDLRYRYTLTRTWNPEKPTVVWIGLNPSTADERALDPTLRRVLAFSDDWGFGTFVMLNLFAFRARDPMKMIAASEPVGPDNDAHIAIQTRGRQVVCAWGANVRRVPQHKNRDAVVMGILRESASSAWHLGQTLYGHPKHPLYLPSSTERRAWFLGEGKA